MVGAIHWSIFARGWEIDRFCNGKSNWWHAVFPWKSWEKRKVLGDTMCHNLRKKQGDTLYHNLRNTPEKTRVTLCYNLNLAPEPNGRTMVDPHESHDCRQQVSQWTSMQTRCWSACTHDEYMKIYTWSVSTWTVNHGHHIIILFECRIARTKNLRRSPSLRRKLMIPKCFKAQHPCLTKLAWTWIWNTPERWSSQSHYQLICVKRIVLAKPTSGLLRHQILLCLKNPTKMKQTDRFQSR